MAAAAELQPLHQSDEGHVDQGPLEPAAGIPPEKPVGFRAYQSGDPWWPAWSVIAPDLHSWIECRNAATDFACDRASHSRRLTTLMTVNALLLGFSTSLAYSVTHEDIAEYAPRFAVSWPKNNPCAEVDLAGLCTNRTHICQARMYVTAELMHPALLTQGLAMFALVLGLSIACSLGSNDLDDDACKAWARVFFYPIQLLMATFFLELASFMRIVNRVVAVRFPMCDSTVDVGMCGRALFRQSTWTGALWAVTAVWLMHTRLKAQVCGKPAGHMVFWMSTFVILACFEYKALDLFDIGLALDAMMSPLDSMSNYCATIS